ncbi:hypothetical protein D3C80_1972800 [compost metagenome]
MIQVLVEILGLDLFVDEDVRPGDRRAQEVIGTERCAVGDRAPVMGQLLAVVAELQQRLDHFLIGFLCFVNHRLLQLRVVLGNLCQV